MTQGQIIRPEWKRNLAGLRELSNWAGVTRPALWAAIKDDPDFPEPEDFLGSARVWKFAQAEPALIRLGFSEGGGPREWGIKRKLAARRAEEDG